MPISSLSAHPRRRPTPSVGNYCAAAPDAIRNAFGWPGVLGHHDFDIDGYLLPERVYARWTGATSTTAKPTLPPIAHRFKNTSPHPRRGRVPLVLGGDDSIPIPVLEAYREHGPLTILQLRRAHRLA